MLFPAAERITLIIIGIMKNIKYGIEIDRKRQQFFE
jgi:hypothetical protein